MRASGDLTPRSCAISERKTPQLEAIQHRMTATKIERSIAQQSWLPNLNLQGSWIAVDANSTSAQGWGGQVGFSFPLSNAPSVRQKNEELRALTAEHQLLDRNLQGSKQALKERCVQFLKLAQEAESGLKQTQRLAQKTKQGYAAGYHSLDDLINIQKALLSDQLFVLDLRYAARQAYMRSVILYGAVQ